MTDVIYVNLNGLAKGKSRLSLIVLKECRSRISMDGLMYYC